MRNELFTVTPVWIFVSLMLLGLTNGQQCIFTYPCACSSSDFVVDLYPLMLERRYFQAVFLIFRNKPRKPLTALGKKPNTTYYLNPCGEPLTVSSCISLGDTAAGCQLQDNVSYGIAKTTGYMGAGDAYYGTVHFTYSFEASDGEIRTTILSVKCSTSYEAEFTFLGEETLRTYPFLLKTRFACRSPSSSYGLSLGSVSLIFFVILAIYFIGGCLFQNFVRNAQGLEIIPNYEFWKDLPVFVKDGMVFTSQKVKGSSTYEKI